MMGGRTRAGRARPLRRCGLPSVPYKRPRAERPRDSEGPTRGRGEVAPDQPGRRDYVFRFAVGGHKLTVTHSDGQPVEPVEVDVVRIGTGRALRCDSRSQQPRRLAGRRSPRGQERGWPALSYAMRRVASPHHHRPTPGRKELSGRFLSYGDLRTTREEIFPADGLFGGPDRTLDLTLSGGMGNYVWTIDGQAYPDADPIEVSKGEWVRFPPHQPEHDGPPHAPARPLLPTAKRHGKGAVQGHGARRASHGRGDVRLRGG